jgi:hypothetical protein
LDVRVRNRRAPQHDDTGSQQSFDIHPGMEGQSLYLSSLQPDDRKCVNRDAVPTNARVCSGTVKTGFVRVTSRQTFIDTFVGARRFLRRSTMPFERRSRRSKS